MVCSTDKIDSPIEEGLGLELVAAGKVLAEEARRGGSLDPHPVEVADGGELKPVGNLDVEDLLAPGILPRLDRDGRLTELDEDAPALQLKLRKGAGVAENGFWRELEVLDLQRRGFDRR